jgi:hypothetical protein
MKPDGNLGRQGAGLMEPRMVPPLGFMWFFWKLVPIEEAEEQAKSVMRGFDKLPRKERDKQNYSEPLPRPIRQTSKSANIDPETAEAFWTYAQNKGD